MSNFIDKVKRSHLYILFLFSVFFGLLMSRRWAQIISPQVWVEDGSQIVKRFLIEGWVAFFEPVNGYLVTVPKIISIISLSISLLHYPLISTILTWIFIAMVGVAITIAPTRLNGKFFCAIAIFVIPTAPEVFGLTSYAFWWAALPLFLLTLWNENHSNLGWRLAFLIFGGLSSPVIILVLPILYFRVYLYRTFRVEYIIAIIATLIATVQLFFIMSGSAGQIPPLYSILLNTVPTFFGGYLLGNWIDNRIELWIIGLGLIFVMLSWFYENRAKVYSWILMFLLLGSIGLTVMRVDPAALHPAVAGPRYLFYPYILISWVLIQYFCTTKKTGDRLGLGIIGMILLINCQPLWEQQHEDLQWSAHVRTCRLFEDYAIPVQFHGPKTSAWYFQIPGESCEKYISSTKKEYPTFAYVVRDKNIEHPKIALISSTMTGTDFQKSQIDDYQVIGSFVTSDADTGEVVVRLRRGDSFLYRSGPKMAGQSISIEGYEQTFLADLPGGATDWVTMEFSNPHLPDTFVVTIKDDGVNWG